jgi:hypothetical protein
MMEPGTKWNYMYTESGSYEIPLSEVRQIPSAYRADKITLLTLS